MVKHTPTIRRQIVFDHFVGLALKGLRQNNIKPNLLNIRTAMLLFIKMS